MFPWEELEGKVKFYASSKDRRKFNGIVRSSLNHTYQKDGELTLSLLRKAEQISRPVDPKKLARKALYRVEPKKGKGKQATLVSVPEPEVAPVTAVSETLESTESAITQYSEIQYRPLTLGAELGLDVWIARKDRGRKWNGAALGSLPNMLDELGVT